MLRSQTTNLATLIAVAMLAGCAQTKDWLDRVTPGGNTRSDGTVILGAPTAGDYLREIHLLATGDPATQIEIFANAESRATLTPGPSTNLRYALALATPGHTESDPQRAQSLLREALAERELLTTTEIELAEIYLTSVETAIVLNGEVRRLRQSSSRQALTEEQAANQRIASVEADNRRLRRNLEEAEQKLEALSTIEREIREQEQ